MGMVIRVLLFGPEAAAAGVRAVEVDVADGARTAAAVLGRIGEACPALRGRLGSARLAVNGEFAAPAQAIGVGDEVALIGLVSGG